MILDLPPAQMQKQFGRSMQGLLGDKELQAIASNQFDGDTLKVLVVLVDWNNRPHTYAPGAFDSLYFSHWALPTNSVADYYEEVSYGQLTVTGDVFGWFNAGTYDPEVAFWPLFDTLDALIDFSQYDGNHDGVVDALVFVRSGTGEEDSMDPNDIWSYAFIYPPGEGDGPHDGVYIEEWNTCPEERPQRDSTWGFLWGVDTLNTIRVFCHELGHNLGLPDLYDYDAKLDAGTYDTPSDSNDHPLVDWCLMGYGGYGLMSAGGTRPSHLCGWSKAQLGWITPEVRYATFQDQQIVLNNIETTNIGSLYKVPIDNTTGEYFLLEFRNPESGAAFDRTDSDFSPLFPFDVRPPADTLERGLLITHVQDSVASVWPLNNGAPVYPNYRVMVEDAGYNPAMPVNSNPEGHASDSALWWYPWEIRKGAPFTSEVPGKEVFSPTTFPNSDGYGGPTGITIRVDSIVDDKLYANLHRDETQYPQFAAHLAGSDLCHISAAPGDQAVSILFVDNYGTAPLMADISVSEGSEWMSVVNPSVQVGPGQPAAESFVQMDATALAEGIYEGELRFDHNDGTQISPQFIRVELHVDADYRCAQKATLRTAVASPGVLSLTVESAGRFGFGSPPGEDGLLRPADSSESVFDGSLVLAHGPMNPDTIAFYNFYSRVTDPGFRGFVADEAIKLDTSAYGTGTGNATAKFSFKTKDEVLHVNGIWYFPQSPDSAEFVLARYTVSNMSTSTVSDIVVGEWVDFDVVPGQLFSNLQQGIDNYGAYVPADNLVYQFGRTKSTLTPTPPLDLAERYSSGIAYLSGRDYAGTGLPFTDTQVDLCAGVRLYDTVFSVWFNGPIDEYIYGSLSSAPGVSIDVGTGDGQSDLCSFMTLDQGLTLAPGESQDYVVAFMSDTLTHPNMPTASASRSASALSGTLDKARAWAANYNIYGGCNCPKQSDMNADGMLDAVDLNGVIQAIFFNGTNPTDPDCTTTRADFNNDGFPDAVDLNGLIQYLFFNAPGACDPCDAVTSTCAN